MEVLPDELLQDIALRLPLKELARLCRTSSRHREICCDESFWRARLRQDFPRADLTAADPTMEYDRQLQLAEVLLRLPSLLQKRVRNERAFTSLSRWVSDIAATGPREAIDELIKGNTPTADAAVFLIALLEQAAWDDDLLAVKYLYQVASGYSTATLYGEPLALLLQERVARLHFKPDPPMSCATYYGIKGTIPM